MSAIAFFAPGTPRPKGSMRHVGNGRLVEQVAGSKGFRAAVVDAALPIVTDQPGQLRDGYPLTRELTATLTFVFDRPKSRKTGGPCTRSTGDLDKLQRNVFDALQDAGVIKDDAQITDVRASKRYAEPGWLAGVHIRIEQVCDYVPTTKGAVSG